jgi:hypothetical protein
MWFSLPWMPSQWDELNEGTLALLEDWIELPTDLNLPRF